MDPVRVRFAPSPTGPLHIGGVRTALYNYLLARKTGGKFLLRIEDTDRTRFVPGAEAYILEALDWLGITPDEGPQQGGDYGPYRQSERKALYQKYAAQLVESGHAYYAFDTPEELEAMRAKAVGKATVQYDAFTRSVMQNALTLPQQEVKARLAVGMPYVIRFKVPRNQTVRFKDTVRGWNAIRTQTLDDKVLLKQDGMATYHLANIVDDHLMRITHVIRGEEWLPSAPLHEMLYRAFGWTPPQWVHLPLLLKSDGQGKLSKRDAISQGYPIFPLQWQDPKTGEVSQGFREAGYLPEALLNFVALLGWHPSGNEERFSLPALVKIFSLDRISKAGAKFNIEKARWLNGKYLRDKPAKELATYLLDKLAAKKILCTEEKALQIATLMKERIVFWDELVTQTTYFFAQPNAYEPKTLQTKLTSESYEALQLLLARFEEWKGFAGQEIKANCKNICTAQGIKMGQLLPLLRLAITGHPHGLDLVATLTILGHEEVVQRIAIALKKWKS